MLVAKREPFEFGAHDRPVPVALGAHPSSRFTRMLNILQMVGALIAVPAGLGSAYTMYKTNFSPEASCQTLRANIVAMLDRSVDAATRRILVRRDVESFEQTCGAVDPEATAAFKVLLAAKTAPAEAWTQSPQTTIRKIEMAPAPKADAVAVTKVEKTEPAPVAKMEPAPAKEKDKAKPAAVRMPAVAGAPPPSEVTDAAWVAAVRSALVTQETHTVAAPASVAPSPRVLGELPAPQVLPSAPEAAPTLPPPAAIATVGAPANLDHPVPPGAIPETLPQEAPKKRSRVGEWVGDIPFFGKSLADHVTR